MAAEGWRRERRYCTVLVNLETNEVVDFLPDPEAATVTAWLRYRPGWRSSPAIGPAPIPTPSAGALRRLSRLLIDGTCFATWGETVQALGNRHSAATRRAAEHVRAHLTARRYLMSILCQFGAAGSDGRPARIQSLVHAAKLDMKRPPGCAGLERQSPASPLNSAPTAKRCITGSGSAVAERDGGGHSS